VKEALTYSGAEDRVPCSWWSRAEEAGQEKEQEEGEGSVAARAVVEPPLESLCETTTLWRSGISACRESQGGSPEGSRGPWGDHSLWPSFSPRWPVGAELPQLELRTDTAGIAWQTEEEEGAPVKIEDALLPRDEGL